MFAEWSRSLSFLRTVEVLLWAVYVSQCLFLRSTRQHQLCAAALAGPNYRARCWSWTFCLSSIYLLYPGNDTAKSARSHRLLSLAWVNICLHFRNLFCGQTVKPSEFPIATDPKIKQRELPLCSQYSTERWNVQAAVNRGEDAFVIQHPASHVHATQQTERLSVVGPSALSEVFPSF